MQDLKDFLDAFRAGEEAKKAALFIVEWMRKGGYEEPQFGSSSIIAQKEIGSDTKTIFGIDTRGNFYLCLDHRGRNIDINRTKPFTKGKPEREGLFSRLA